MVIVCQIRDGLADFGLSIEFEPDTGWRVYIIFDPFRRSCDQNLDLPYQSIDNAGRRYVDWSSRIQTLDEAKTVARIWAELAYRDQRTRQERALYVELIEHQLKAQRQRGITSADPARPDRAPDVCATDSGDQQHAPPIPPARAPAQGLSTAQQRGWSVA